MSRCWILVLLAASNANAMEEAPRPPCAGAPTFPAYATDAEAPAIRVWSALDWQPAPCVGWSAGKYRFVVALAAEMRAAGVDDILARLGAISATRGLKYWSVTEQGWKVLIEDAFALTQPKGARRNDFSALEMKPGHDLYFREKDNRSSREVTYRMRVLAADPDRVIVDSANIDPIRSFGITFFPAGSLHTLYEFDRREGTRWGLYLLSAATEEASVLVAVGRGSYVNRLAAAYGHLANLPEPVRPQISQ